LRGRGRRTNRAERALAPIVVGITGKRDLLGKDEAVRRALRAVFDLLDRRLPASRKILLTGLAAGSDTIAAEEALGRRGWRVIAVLPLDPELYAQDFDDDGASLYKALGDPRISRRQLQPLQDRDGKPFTRAALSRAAGQSNPERTDHYEQAGLFIAERCAALIAVMPAEEQPGRVGGSARIVEFRLAGPDRRAAEIIARSSELRPPVVLDAPQTGPVWLVDLGRVDAAPKAPLRAVTLRRPTTDAGEAGAPGTTRWLRRRDLVDGLELATAIERLNAHLVGLSAREWQRVGITPGRPETADPAAQLDYLRRGVATIQQGFIRRHRWVVPVIAVLFVAGAFFLELHIEFDDGRSLQIYADRSLQIYAAILALIFTLFSIARIYRWQRYAEDYRAVAEALRVQIGWWDAGLTGLAHRVERSFLVGAAGALGLVRTAVRHLVDAAALEQSPSAGSMTRVDDWITGQIKYFRQTAEKRQSRLSLLEDLSGVALFVSIGIWFGRLAPTLPHPLALGLSAAIAAGVVGKGVLLLLPWMTKTAPRGRAGSLALAVVYLSRLAKRSRTLFDAMAGIAAGAVLSSIASLGSVASGCPDGIADKSAGAAAVAGVALGAALLGGRIARAQRLEHRSATTLGAFAGVAAAALYGLMIYFPGASCALAGKIVPKLVAVVAVTILAAAGALRFVAERLALDAEAPRYAEARGTFERAPPALAASPAQPILLELGKRALEESESWIRAHRARRLIPHP
jgi:hypothetical protein